MKTAHILTRAAGSLVAGLAIAAPAQAALYWDFAYSAAGISASGILTTTEVADSNGYYLVTGIQGERNGSVITGLQATGTAIPLNEPYTVDNLVRADGRLTTHGLGFATASGGFGNVYFADFLAVPQVVEFASLPSSGSFTEQPVSWQFSARSAPMPPVPEPASAALALAGLAVVGGAAMRQRRAACAHPQTAS